MENIKKNMISIDKAINNSKNIVLFAILLSFLSVILALGTAFYLNNKQANNIFVLDKIGNIGNAEQQNISVQLEAEADNHLRMFYATFFSYDAVNVDANVKKGIELGGQSVKELWRMYQNENWYSRVKQGNLIVKSEVDSTFFDFENKPYRARVYGKQTIGNGNVEETRTLNIDCVLLQVSRLKNVNPHGLLIDKIKITSNIKIE